MDRDPSPPYDSLAVGERIGRESLLVVPQKKLKRAAPEGLID